MTELDELKQILLGEEQSTISELRERIVDREQRTQDMAECLSESLSLSATKGPELTQSLQAPVTECVKHVAREDTRVFADALFPVIMPAIRRSILETLRTFVQNINQIIDQSFSAQGVRWRLEALRTGVPFHEIVLKHTLVYRVEQVFLCHRKTGVLIDHVSHPEVNIKDKDAVSAMFTAIQDFVHDSFGTENPSDLDSIDIGGHTTWLIYSPHALLACVIRGIAPLKLRERLILISEDIDRRFGKVLEDFEGDEAAVPELKPILQNCLDLKLKSTADSVSQNRLRPSPALLVLLVTLAGLTAYWLVTDHLEKRRLNTLRTTLEASPGIIVIDSSMQQDKQVFRGLRDPLAADPMDIAQSLGFDKEQVAFPMTAYHSAEDPIVLQRAYQRLNVPKSVQLTLTDGTLEAAGTAPYQWINNVEAYGRYITGVDRIDLSKVTADDYSLRQEATALLNPPDGIELNVERGRLYIRGEAPWWWLQPLPAKLDKLQWMTGLGIEHLTSRELNQLERLLEKTHNKNFYFSFGIQLREDSRIKLQQMIPELRRMSNLVDTLGATLQITLVGYTDGTGGSELNLRLRDQRAHKVLHLLTSAGLNPKLFTIGKATDLPKPKFIDLKQRRVTLSVHTDKVDLTRLFTK